MYLNESEILEIVNNTINEQNVGENIYPNFDKFYNYKVQNGEWFASKKTAPDKWFSIRNYPTSIAKLDKAYPNARKRGINMNKIIPTPLKLNKNVKPNKITTPTNNQPVNTTKPPTTSNAQPVNVNKNDTQSGGIKNFLRKVAPNVAQMFFTKPLNGNDFSNKQKEVIYNVIQNSIKRGSNKKQGYVTYVDYGRDIDQTFNNNVGASTKDMLTRSFIDPSFQVASTLGQFAYKLQPDGTYLVTDTYDFSKSSSYTVTNKELQNMSYFQKINYIKQKDKLSLYRTIRELGYLEHPNTANPKDKIPINIIINPKDYA